MIYKNGFLIPNNKRKRNQLQQTHKALREIYKHLIEGKLKLIRFNSLNIKAKFGNYLL